MERNGQTECSASDGSQNHDRPFCLKCALLCNSLRFQLFFLNFRKTKEKMQIKGRIQSWNLFFIEIHKFLTFLVVKFFMQGER